jgi:hypothetical protein
LDLGGSDTELVAADAAFETCVANEFLFPHSELGFVRTAAARRVEISLTMTALGPLTEIAAALLLRWHPLTLIRKQAKAKSAVYLRVFRWSRAHSTHSADGVILHSLDLDPSRQCLLATTSFFSALSWAFCGCLGAQCVQLGASFLRAGRAGRLLRAGRAGRLGPVMAGSWWLLLPSRSACVAVVHCEGICTVAGCVQLPSSGLLWTK